MYTWVMKHTVEYNLPEDQYLLDLALDASNLRDCLDDLRDFFRQQYKYREVQSTTWSEVHLKFWEIVNESEVKVLG